MENCPLILIMIINIRLILRVIRIIKCFLLSAGIENDRQQVTIRARTT